jgi:hypothetical protein
MRRRDFIKGIAGSTAPGRVRVNIVLPHQPAIIEGRDAVEGRDPMHESRKAVQA